MSITIDQAFIPDFEDDVKLAYQQGGSKARGTVRLKTNVTGSTSRFQKVGKGTANKKARHGRVPPMNAQHSYADAAIEDWHAGDWVDKLDEYKINIDERQAMIMTGASALGRKVDGLIFAAARSGLPTAQKVTCAGSSPTLVEVMEAFEIINDNDVPDDGYRFCACAPKFWNGLLSLEQFSNADYVGADTHPFLTGTQAKKWLNIVWYLSTQLTKDSSNYRYNIMYHKTAIGWAEGQDVTVDITWNGPEQAYWVNASISGGAVAIDQNGIVEIRTDES